jgi:hypothetical protein
MVRKSPLRHTRRAHSRNGHAVKEHAVGSGAGTVDLKYPDYEKEYLQDVDVTEYSEQDEVEDAKREQKRRLQSSKKALKNVRKDPKLKGTMLIDLTEKDVSKYESGVPFEKKKDAERFAIKRMKGFAKLKEQTNDIKRKKMLDKAINSVKIRQMDAFGKKEGYIVMGQ